MCGWEQSFVEGYSNFKIIYNSHNFNCKCERMEIIKMLRSFMQKMIKHSFPWKFQTQLRSQKNENEKRKELKEVKNNLRIGGVNGVSIGEMSWVYGRARIFRKWKGYRIHMLNWKMLSYCRFHSRSNLANTFNCALDVYISQL